MESIKGLGRLSLAGRFSLALSAIVGVFFLIAAAAVFWHTATLKGGDRKSVV